MKLPGKITRLSEADAIGSLQRSGNEFLSLLERNNLSVEIYKPRSIDRQLPHDRDEFYLIIAGEGYFELEGESIPFQKGDFIFVPAQAEHRFTSFTPDFTTWVFFI